VDADGGTKEEPVLHAHFVKGFVPKPERDYKYTVYRIKAWLKGLPELKVEPEGPQELRGALRVTYDLHPENGRPISRAAFGPRHEIWLNTNSNYKVRARTNDGREWDLGCVHDALERENNKADVKRDDGSQRRFEDALNDVRTTRKQKDQGGGGAPLGPTLRQLQFFQDTIEGRENTILALKRVEGIGKGETRGFSVNIRGPFMLEDYKFKSICETVVDAVWANAKAKASNNQESDSHLHCVWDHWKFAVLSPTSSRVKENIEYEHQLAFFNEKVVAEAYKNAKEKDNNKALFWFYLKNDQHDACKCVPQNQVIDISTWPDQSLRH
jgi:hypothetical protein